MKRYLVSFLSFGLLTATFTTLSSEVSVGAETAPPNVVVIMLDDISTGYMDAMPFTKTHIIDQGISYTNGVVPTALCCPSRASFLTGKYAHSSGVYSNNNQQGHGAWGSFQPQEAATLATALDPTHRTMLIGKYINGYKSAPTNYVPAGWNKFTAFKNIGYYNWSTGGSEVESYGNTPADYSTDVLAAKAAQWVANTKPETQLFMYWSPYSAHKPYQPAPRHEGTWHQESVYGAFNVAGADKPQFIRDKNTMAQYDQLPILQAKHEMLMSADEGVEQIWNALGDRVDNTIFILMSDNGWLLGDHRMTSKDAPYQHATEVEMAVRWDGQITPGSSDDRVTTNIDLTQLILDAVGVTLSGSEGRNPLTLNRVGTVLEQVESTDSLGSSGANLDEYHPAYCGWRTSNWLFVRWNTGEEELYDYVNDPNETVNVAGDPNQAAKLNDMRTKAINNCDPVPPGFSW